MISTIKNINIILLLFCLSPLVGESQMNPDSLVWPGDINNNGVVNHVDVLYLGVAYGTQGEQRNSQTVQWNGVDAPSNWNSSFPDGLSMSFADCNGDGVVSDNDLQGIQVNYGLEHDSIFEDSFLLDENAIDAQILFDTLGLQVQGIPGETYSIPISLGDQNEQISNFYGLAFTLEVNTDYIDLSSLNFVDFEGKWTDPNSTGLVKFQERSFSTNIFQVALSRTNMLAISGEGDIGKLIFIIEDDLPDYAPGIEVITIKDIYLLDENLTQHYLVEGNSIALDFVNPTQNLQKNEFSIYPNPISQGTCFIKGLENYPSAEVKLFDIVGREVPIIMDGNNMNTGELPVGMYLINIHTPKGQWTERVFINNKF